MPFDVEGARKSGYTDAEIADHLAQHGGFDAAGARKSGYTDADIIGHLTGATPRPEPTPIDDRTGARLSHRFIIGSANDDATKLERARALYGDSAQPEADGRISFVNPDTGRRTYVNPSGFDVGDLFGSGREIASAAVTLPFDASVVGIPAAAMVGAGVGEAADSLAAMLARYEAGKRGNTAPQVQGVGDAAKDFATDAAVGAAAGGVMAPVGKGLSKVINPTSERLVQAWRDLGMQPPTLASVSEGRAVPMVEGWLGDTLTGGAFIERGARAGREGLDKALADTAERIGGSSVPTTPDELGVYAKRVAEGSKAEWQKKTAEAAKSLFETFGTDNANLDNTVAWLNGETAKLSPEAGDALRRRVGRFIAAEMSDAAPLKNGAQQPSALNVHTLQALRTRIGQLMDDPKVATTNDVDAAVFGKLYDTVTQDIEAALSGSPQNLMAFREFNAKYAKEKETRDLLERMLFAQGDPARIGQALLSPSLTPSTVEAMKSLLGEEGFNGIRAGILRQLGTPRAGSHFAAGEASPSTFSTITGQGRGAYHPEVQRDLFGGDLDAVRAIGESLARAGKTVNTSRTAPTHEMFRLARSPAQWAQGAAMVADPIASLSVPMALGWAHTSPTVINALSSPTARRVAGAVEQALPRAGVIGGLMSAPNE